MWRLEVVEMFALEHQSLKCEFTPICCEYTSSSQHSPHQGWYGSSPTLHMALSLPLPYLSSFLLLSSLFLWFHPYLTQSYFFHLPLLPQNLQPCPMITAEGYLFSVFRQAAFMAPPVRRHPGSQRSCSLSSSRGWCAARAAAPGALDPQCLSFSFGDHSAEDLCVLRC